MNNSDHFGSFRVPGHSTKREWAVYLIVATNQENPEIKKVYVGKTGDNREGCNPVISRVGNHFSFNKVHSQIRNKVIETEKYDYDYFYYHFGKYTPGAVNIKKDQINELERRLNKKVQKYVNRTDNIELLNPYSGRHISKKESERREKLVNKNEEDLLSELIKNALTTNES